jgi:DNA-binding phage protein
MNKKKTLTKQEFSLKNALYINIDDKNFTKFNSEDFFKDHQKVADSLLQCLIDNDTESYMEILESYLRVNKSQVSQKAKLSRSTVSVAFSKKGNPTLKTVAKIVHEAVHSKR